MLKTDSVIKLLKKNKVPMSFDEIWAAVREETINSVTSMDELTESKEIEIKTSLYTSFLEDQLLIMVGGHKWDLKDGYSYNEVNSIEKTRLTEEIELELEKTDETVELELALVTKK